MKGRIVLTIRRLAADDVHVLETLVREAAAFDVEGRAEPAEPLTREDGRAFLSHPDVLFWVAGNKDDSVDGFLLCYVQYLWHAPGREIMLYEIGVRNDARRQGIGKSLVETMEAWMLENQIADVWVPADNPGAEAFYAACGFNRDEEQAVMMSKVVPIQTDRENQ